ncbi:MAG: hypothetical protein KAV48_01890, partial [Methanomicrobia archaeon]|nr:hypothetical protein [Methanomicrobia archaeon]
MEYAERVGVNAKSPAERRDVESIVFVCYTVVVHEFPVYQVSELEELEISGYTDLTHIKVNCLRILLPDFVSYRSDL